MEKCSNCGQECFYTQSPEIVFTDENNIICEDCSIDFCETENGIVRIGCDERCRNDVTSCHDWDTDRCKLHHN